MQLTLTAADGAPHRLVVAPHGAAPRHVRWQVFAAVGGGAFADVAADHGIAWRDAAGRLAVRVVDAGTLTWARAPAADPLAFYGPAFALALDAAV